MAWKFSFIPLDFCLWSHLKLLIYAAGICGGHFELMIFSILAHKLTLHTVHMETQIPIQELYMSKNSEVWFTSE